MTFIKTPLKDCYVIEPKVFGDHRGYFFESFNQSLFEEGVGSKVNFVQDNQSYSKYGILRGLHFQKTQTQGKLVRVIKGSVFDVAVDLRKSSPSFGQWYGLELSAENQKMFWVPEGFAHGFLVTSEDALFLYKTTDYYNPTSETSLLWNDTKLNIQWPKLTIDPVLKEKDIQGLKFEEITYFE